MRYGLRCGSRSRSVRRGFNHDNRFDFFFNRRCRRRGCCVRCECRGHCVNFILYRFLRGLSGYFRCIGFCRGRLIRFLFSGFCRRSGRLFRKFRQVRRLRRRFLDVQFQKFLFQIVQIRQRGGCVLFGLFRFVRVVQMPDVFRAGFRQNNGCRRLFMFRRRRRDRGVRCGCRGNGVRCDRSDHFMRYGFLRGLSGYFLRIGFCCGRLIRFLFGGCCRRLFGLRFARFNLFPRR